MASTPKSGRGSEWDRLSQSPLEIRRSSADPTDIAAGEVQTDAGELNYDKNDRLSEWTDQWAAPGSGPTAP